MIINKSKHNNRNPLILMNCVGWPVNFYFFLITLVWSIRLNTSRPEDASFETIRDVVWSQIEILDYTHTIREAHTYVLRRALWSYACRDFDLTYRMLPATSACGEVNAHKEETVYICVLNKCRTIETEKNIKKLKKYFIDPVFWFRYFRHSKISIYTVRI